MILQESNKKRLRRLSSKSDAFTQNIFVSKTQFLIICFSSDYENITIGNNKNTSKMLTVPLR